MRIFLDCNVLLDVGLQREPFYHTSSQLLDYLEIHKNIGCMAWHSLATFYYIAAKSKNQPLAKQFISDLCQFIYVVPTTNSDYTNYSTGVNKMVTIKQILREIESLSAEAKQELYELLKKELWQEKTSRSIDLKKYQGIAKHVWNDTE